jgi:hypothetical protein
VSPTEATVWLFVLVFLATAAVTLGALVGKIRVQPYYERKLFALLLLQVIGVVISFGTQSFTKIAVGRPDLRTLLTANRTGWDWQYANKSWRGNLVFSADPQGRVALSGVFRDFSRTNVPVVVQFRSKPLEMKAGSDTAAFTVEVESEGAQPAEATMTLQSGMMVSGDLVWSNAAKRWTNWGVVLTPGVVGWDNVPLGWSSCADLP